MNILKAGIISVSMASMLTAQVITGGDASSEATANIVLDMVFAIDTSGSMDDEASSISSNLETAIKNLSCSNDKLWVNAQFVGIDGTWSGTLFDETAQSVLASSGDAVTINNYEDNGPVVYDFANASNYFLDTTTSSQTYRKAIMTIGDEGLENGEPVVQDDYDSGKAANDAAITNGVAVFSMLGNNPATGASDIFEALAVGGKTLGGHVFNPTGGTFTTTASGTDWTNAISSAVCTAAVAPTPAAPTVAVPLSFGGKAALAFLLAMGSFFFMRRKNLA